MKSSVIYVTPALAAEWLKKNNINRKLRQDTVADYARDMANGDWRATHQGIAFADDGTLVDGQHRLHAVVKSGVTVGMTVTNGIDKSAFQYIDGGLARTAGEKLGVTRPLVEVAKFSILISGEGVEEQRRPSLSRIKEVCDTLEGDVTRLLEACPSTRKGASSVPVRAAAVVLLREQPENAGAILNSYRSLVLRKYDEMSPAAQSFIRQIDSGRIHTSGVGRLDTFARALMAMDPTRSSSVVKVYDPAVSRKRAAQTLRKKG